MKVMTFNTQHCMKYPEQKINFPRMADTILCCRADIVGLNEMYNAKPGTELGNQVEILAQLTGLSYHFFAEAFRPDGISPYGNGLLSRYPISHTEVIPIPDPEPRKYNGYYETRCLLKAVLANSLTVLVCHFGLNPDEQENAVQTILPHLTEEKCVLMGDFNTTPDSGILDPIRRKMKDTADCFTVPKLSFPADAPTKKIDYIFVSPDITILSADIPNIAVSDHLPHTAEILL